MTVDAKEIVSQVEEIVGVGHQAWDVIKPERIICAVIDVVRCNDMTAAAHQLAAALVEVWDKNECGLSDDQIAVVNEAAGVAREIVAAREAESKGPDPHYTSEIDPEFYM